MQRIGIFVDIINQVTAISEKKKGHRVNYARYLEMLKEGENQIVVAIAYGTQMANEADSFIFVLKKLGYVTKFTQGRWNRNVEITLDVIHLTSQNLLDVVIFGSNSPELVPLIHRLQMDGIKVVVATPCLTHNEGTSNIDLLTTGETVEYIQDMRGNK